MVMPKKEKWRICETTKKIDYERKGCQVIPTGKGSDFAAICPSQPLTLVEVKQGCGPLTKFQKETRKKAIDSGLEFKIERCSCSKKNRKKT
jgi:hypothetical protein